MKACVVMTDYGSQMRAWAREKGCQKLAGKATPRPWIAKPSGDKREFIEGITDYSASNPDGSAGVRVKFFCEVGAEYVFSQPLPRGGARVFKGRVMPDGTIEEITGN